MSNHIFEEILSERIQVFIKSFNDTSEKIFIDPKTGKLIHPGEYGIYREKILKEFLRLIIPHKLEINTGFIIGENGYVSSQCDVVIYDRNVTPLIQSSENQLFYPIQTTVGIGEVKSKIKKPDIIKALLKLAKNKIERASMKATMTIHRGTPKDTKGNIYKFDPKVNPNDQIFTFLICKEFDFDFDNFIEDVISEYEKNSIPVYARHNIILSLQDGIFLYKNPNGISTFCPVIHGEKQKMRMVKSENKSNHIRIFAINTFLATSSGTIVYPEMSFYMGSIPKGTIKDEK